MRITLEQWRMFKAVADNGGFNHAASKVHKSQSSVHSAVGKIEQSLNVKLFDVVAKKTTLTAQGELLYRRAKFLLDEAEKVESIGQALSHGIETSLTIAVDEMFPAHWLCEALDKTTQKFNHLRVEIIESVLSGANELLDNGQADVAISSVNDNTKRGEELCQINFIAVASPLHPLSQVEAPISLEELKSHRQIVVRDSSKKRNMDVGWLESHQRWTVSHMRTSIEILAKGLGFAWLPQTGIEQAMQSQLLTPLNLSSGAQRTATLHLLTKSGDLLGPAASEFVEQLHRVCTKNGVK